MSIYTDILRKFSMQIDKVGPSEIFGISTDTRSIKPGELFVALRGENFNGHDYISMAIEKGAAGVVVDPRLLSSKLQGDIWVIHSENPLDTYQEIARLYLETKRIKKIGVTGTSGKTTTKEFIRAFLATRYNVFANQGNLNNQVGVPLSALQVGQEEIGIFEMGTGKPGDIRKLNQIVKPETVVVTSVGEGHLEYFGTVRNVAMEKAEIAIGAYLKLCPDEIQYQDIFADYTKVSLKMLDSYEINSDGYEIVLKGQKMQLPYWGKYNLYNFALAAQVALEFGLNASDIRAGISGIRLPHYRQEKKEKNGVTYFLDCYNANPLSMKKALEGFAALPGNKIVVLGDMLELGEGSEEMHGEIGLFLNQFSFSKVFFYGPKMQFAYHSCRLAKDLFQDKSQLSQVLGIELKSGDKVLCKASRGMKLEELFASV